MSVRDTITRLPRADATATALRDRLDSSRAKVVPFKRIDPATAVIERGRQLLQTSRDAWAVPDPDGEPSPAKIRAQDAVWAHLRGPLSRTVPTTAAGCVDLARYVVEFHAFQGLDLDVDALPIIAVIARSPLL